MIAMTTLKGDVEEAAYAAYRRWKRYAEFGDITQQVWMWLADGWPEKQQLEPADLKKRMRNAAERYCRKEKASKAGYDTTDETYYSINQLERLIWDALDPEATPGNEGFRDDERYSEWVTEVADIRSALTKIPAKYRNTLINYVNSKEKERTTEVDTALWRLKAQLGGSRPT